jgi:Zn-dependent protease
VVEASAPVCASCGAQLSPAALACPACQTLVHRDELQRLATEAEEKIRQNERSEALVAWRRALELLPPQSRQYQVISGRIQTISREIDTEGSRANTDRKWTLTGIALFIFAQGKLLLTGLTKAPTFLSVLVSLGVYWAAFGYKFALGLLACMYVHEMGHVAALRRYGIAMDPPMFIPGLGAFVRLKQYPVDAREDARVGLAGPIWGFGAALFVYGLAYFTNHSVLYAIARGGAWMNLFNLIPIGPLDGGRGFRALTRPQRLLAMGVIAIAWLWTSDGMLIALLLGALFRVAQAEAPKEPDRGALIQYALLIAGLTWLSTIRVPGV